MPDDPFEDLSKFFNSLSGVPESDETRAEAAKRDAQQFAKTIRVLHESLVESGFTDDQAFQLTFLSSQIALSSKA